MTDLEAIDAMLEVQRAEFEAFWAEHVEPEAAELNALLFLCRASCAVCRIAELQGCHFGYPKKGAPNE